MNSVLDDFYKVSQYFDEPISNMNFLNSYWQSRQAKSEGFKVILTGDGSDEIFCGYDRYYNLFIAEKLSMFSFISKKIKKYNSVSINNINSFFYSIFRNSELSKLFSKNENYEFVLDSLKSNNKIDQINYFDFKYWLTNESNYKLDKCTMINSIEARVPFQDRKLIEKLFFLENRSKFKFFDRKFILKENKILPRYILNRKKMGWFSPERIFLDNNLLDIKDTFFRENEIKNQEVFNYEELKSLFNLYDSQGFKVKRKITTIILFQIWYNKVLSL